MQLPALIQTFVLHFGEMGSRWGMNRSTAQIYALLYLSDVPLNADQMVTALGFSRSNIASALKELLSMNLVMLRHMPDDRKDYYVTHQDIWDMMRSLIEARRKREVEPTLNMLHAVTQEQPTSEQEQRAQQKMQEMYGLMQMLTEWYQNMQRIETERLIQLMNMGNRICRLYPFRHTDENKKEHKQEGAPASDRTETNSQIHNQSEGDVL